MRSFTKWAALFVAAIVGIACLGIPTAYAEPAPLTQMFVGLIGATVGTGVLTLSDWAKGQDPNGKPARIIEMLTQTNEILQDIPFMEGNLPTGHRTTIRTGLPTVYWRLLNQGVPSSKSSKVQVTESVGMLEAHSTVDVEVANLNGNAGATRLGESRAFLEAMAQEAASTLFYGNSSTAPEEFTGLSARYSSLSAANARNIVVGGSADTDNTSIWLIVWGENQVHGIFPRGSQAGLEHKDMGEQLIQEEATLAGRKLLAFVDIYRWKLGLVVADWGYAVRIPNIEVSALVANSSPPDLTLLMTKAIHRITNLNAGRAVFYANRTVVAYLDIQRQAAVKAGGGLTWDNIDGKVQMSFRGIPIKTVDALLENEALVS